MATNSFDDIERARAILLCGANPTEDHPVVGARIRQAACRGAPLIVIDPRRIELTADAACHLAIKPGTNVAVLNAMAHVIATEQLTDREFLERRVDGVHAFIRFIREWTPARAAQICGVDAEAIELAARLYATWRPAMTMHGLGLTEHVQGTEGVIALTDLALLTGNLGRPGGGVNPLRALELVIVQDLFLTETAREFGTVFLPACSSFEKDGTFMNAERRIQRVRAALKPLGESAPDWRIVADTARAMGDAGFGFGTSEDIWNEVRRLCPGARGMTYARLDEAGLQWPCPDEDHQGTPILHAGQFSHGYRAMLSCIDHRPTFEQTTEQYPFLLMTGRSLYQFNAGTMTAPRATTSCARPTCSISHPRMRLRSVCATAIRPASSACTARPGCPYASAPPYLAGTCSRRFRRRNSASTPLPDRTATR
jgi:predicted molibdopterin-dependent oxidoreductase YjgC